MTTQRRTRVLLVAATLVGGVAAPVTHAAMTPGTGCGSLSTAPARCPALVQRSPDLPSYFTASVVDARQHRLYLVGPDESGKMTFHAMDTRTSRFVLHATMRVVDKSDPTGSGIYPEQVALTPDGKTLVVAGFIETSSSPVAASAAFDTATGRTRWSHVDDGVAGDTSAAVTVSPDGKRAFFARGAVEEGSSEATLVDAYDVQSGRSRWQASFGAHNNYDHWPMAVTYAQGRLLVLLDETVNHGGRVDYDSALVGYDPSSGRLLGTATFDAGFGDDFLYTATPTTAGVVLTGDSIPSQATGALASAVYASTPVAVSIDPRRMRIQWVTRPAITGISGYAMGAVAVGSHVAVLVNAGTPEPYQARAYGVAVSGNIQPSVSMLDARTGSESWTRSVPTPRGRSSSLEGIATDPSQHSVYVTGGSSLTSTRIQANVGGPVPYVSRPDAGDGLVYAYDTSGSLEWTSDYNVDQSASSYATDFALAVVGDGRLFAVGTFDTHSVDPTAGTVNGLIAAYGL